MPPRNVLSVLHANVLHATSHATLPPCSTFSVPCTVSPLPAAPSPSHAPSPPSMQPSTQHPLHATAAHEREVPSAACDVDSSTPLPGAAPAVQLHQLGRPRCGEAREHTRLFRTVGHSDAAELGHSDAAELGHSDASELGHSDADGAWLHSFARRPPARQKPSVAEGDDIRGRDLASDLNGTSPRRREGEVEQEALGGEQETTGGGGAVRLHALLSVRRDGHQPGIRRPHRRHRARRLRHRLHRPHALHQRQPVLWMWRCGPVLQPEQWVPSEHHARNSPAPEKTTLGEGYSNVRKPPAARERAQIHQLHLVISDMP